MNIITAETTMAPIAATNSFGVPIAIAWRNFSSALSLAASAISTGDLNFTNARLVVAASHARGLWLDASELDSLSDDLAYAEDAVRKAERSIAELIARKQSDWLQGD